MSGGEHNRPSGIIDFSHVFARHPKEMFVGRQAIIAEIDRFLTSGDVKSRDQATRHTKTLTKTLTNFDQNCLRRHHDATE